MTETIKEGDFVEIDYVGILKSADVVFDTSIEAEAKKNDIFDAESTYAPIAICIGQGQILPGLDAALIDLEIGKEHEILLPPASAFGRKDGKLMKLVPTSVFKKQNINPMTGLQVNIDGTIGTIRTVTGGRTVVDFNHPFAGKEIIYKVNVKKKITDNKEKILALIELALNQKREAITINIKESKAIIDLKSEFPDVLLKTLKERITSILTSIKEVEFRTPKKEVKEAPAAQGTEDKTV